LNGLSTHATPLALAASGVDSSLAFRLAAGDAPGPARLHLIRQEPPQRVVRAFANDDGMAVVHLHNLSGGVLGGDQLALAIAVEGGVQAQVTTTGATRVYRHRPGRDAAQHTTLTVGPGALLEYLPDALIPYAGARYHQQTRVTLEEDAGLFYWEVLTPGRVAAGEWFAYDRVAIDLEIWAGDVPLTLERLALTPATRAPNSPVRWGAYGYVATLYACRVGWPAAKWAALEQTLAQWAQTHSTPGDVVWGISTLACHGLVARALSTHATPLAAGLAALWAAAKTELYARPAQLPRKLY
jgi:urease accessory protein